VPPTPTPTPTNSPLTVIDIITDPAEPLLEPEEPIVITIVYTDPTGLAPSYTALWDWGDGSSSGCPPDSAACTLDQSELRVTGSHTFADPGVFNVQLTVTRSDGAVGTSSVEVEVLSDDTDRPKTVTVFGGKGKPVSVSLEHIPAAEHYVTVYNGAPGLKDLDVVVNGHKFKVAGLGDKQEKTIDVASAMVAGKGNTITLTARGKPGGSATVTIW
jgi:hypothetical protein